jgi:anti-sigma-K factor RskA
VQHVDPERLTLLALGEPMDADPTVADHLDQCPACRAEVDGLRRTAVLAREGVDHRDAPAPPAALWDRIAAEAGLGPAPHGRHAAPPQPAPPIRTRRRWVRPVAALVAAAAVGVAGTVAVLRPWASEPATVPASAATLAPVAGGPRDVSGRAVVVQGPDGPRLDVDARGLPLQIGYYEVWVFDGGRNMVSVGVLGADSAAALPLPPTLDLRTYHIVDISAEPYDGDQTHSENSVLRGTLTN